MNGTTKQGFTLIETIIVLSIFSVVAATSVPKVSAALQRRVTASAADQFVGAHSLTRSTALRFGRIAQLHIDVPSQRYWIDVDTTTDGSGLRATIANVRYTTDNGLTMESNRTLLCFDARGLASILGSCESGAAQVIFRNGGMADTVSTTALGKVLR